MSRRNTRKALRGMTPTKQFFVLLISLVASWAIIIGSVAFILIFWRLTYTPAKTLADILCPVGIESNE